MSWFYGSTPTAAGGYGVQARVETSTTLANDKLQVTYDPQWWIHWRCEHTAAQFQATGGYNSGSGDTNTWDTGVVSCYGGSYTTEWTRYSIANRSASFPRKAADYTASVFAWVSSPWGASLARGSFTVPALPVPSAPTAASHTRNSDTQNTLTWTNNGSNPRSANIIERSIDGGGFSQLASVAGSATSYVDTGCQPDHAYAYRLKSRYTANSINRDSAYSAATTTTYNTPSAPQTPRAARNSDNSVTVSFTNGARTETGIEWQRSTDSSTWGNPTARSGADITSFSDTPGGGSFYYRVRNTRGSLASAWTAASNSVVTVIAPAAPTLKGPASGSIINIASASIRLNWQHNPRDGSAQTAARVRYSTDNGATWTTVTVNGAYAYLDLNPQTWAINASVIWQARTKGAHADYGDWSSSWAFSIRQAPQINITSPAADDNQITDMPIIIEWEYSDQSGTQMNARIALYDANGRLLWQRDITGANTSYTLYSSEYLPRNNNDYQIQLYVQSTSTLSVSSEREFSSNYQEPPKPFGQALVDNARAAVELMVVAGVDEQKPATQSLGIFRVHEDGRQVMIANDVESGTAVIDPYCPTDKDITYLFLAYSQTGSVSYVEVIVRIPSHSCLWLNFGDAGEQLAVLYLNHSYDYQNKPTVELFETSGDSLPLVYFGEGNHASGTITGVALTTSFERGSQESLPPLPHIMGFEALSAWIGRVILRMPGKDAFAAYVQTSIRQSIQAYADVSLTWEQVRADGLAI